MASIDKEKEKMYNDCKNLIVSEITEALGKVNEEQIEMLINAILDADTVFLTGVGRVLISLQSFCKRLNHLGIKAYCVGEINEPAATSSSLLIAGSGSGESVCPVAIVKKAHSLGVKIAHIGSNPDSSMKEYTDIFVRVPVKTKLNLEDEIESEQIMSSLFEQCVFILGDAVSMTIAEKKKINVKELWQYHANLE